MRTRFCDYAILTREEGRVKLEGGFMSPSADEVDVVKALDARLQKLIDFAAFDFLIKVRESLSRESYVIGDNAVGEPYIVVLISD